MMGTNFQTAIESADLPSFETIDCIYIPVVETKLAKHPHRAPFPRKLGHIGIVPEDESGRLERIAFL